MALTCSKKGGPASTPTLPGSVVPRAKIIVIVVHGIVPLLVDISPFSVVVMFFASAMMV